MRLQNFFFLQKLQKILKVFLYRLVLTAFLVAFKVQLLIDKRNVRLNFHSARSIVELITFKM